MLPTCLLVGLRFHAAAWFHAIGDDDNFRLLSSTASSLSEVSRGLPADNDRNRIASNENYLLEHFILWIETRRPSSDGRILVRCVATRIATNTCAFPTSSDSE